MSATRDEPDELDGDLAERVGRARPVPDPYFVTRLRDVLALCAAAPRAPAHIGAMIAASALAGVILLVAAASVTFL